MRILVVGLGSMGRKRMRCLQELGCEVYGHDRRADRCEQAEREFGVPAQTDFEGALAGAKPQAMMVCNMPNGHLPFAKFCLQHGIHVFMEENCLSILAPYDEILALAAANPQTVVAPTCCMRFWPSIANMRRLVAEGCLGDVSHSFATYHCGSYLPDWHAYEPIADYYAADIETGGGRDMVPFELHWLEWILGRAVKVTAMTGKHGGYDARIFDTYQLLVEFAGGNTASITVDLLTRWANRYFRLVSERGEISWEEGRHEVQVHSAAHGTWRRIPESAIAGPERGWKQMDMYREETAHFLRAVRGQEAYCCELAEERHLNEIVLAAERSAREGVAVALRP